MCASLYAATGFIFFSYFAKTQTNGVKILFCVNVSYSPPFSTLNPKDAIGATNFKLTTKLGFVIDAMHFTVGDVTKWINVKTVVKLYVTTAQH